jgi:hypothetical protein
VTTIACGLVPALQGTRVNVSAELREARQTSDECLHSSGYQPVPS